MRTRMLEGYRQFFEFDTAWWSLVEPLRATRYVEKTGWVARRYDESTFRSTFPHFGTETFWERETRDERESTVEVAARAGGGDVESNPTLRTAVQKAKAARMTNDAIDRAIKRGTGESEPVVRVRAHGDGHPSANEGREDLEGAADVRHVLRAVFRAHLHGLVGELLDPSDPVFAHVGQDRGA